MVELAAGKAAVTLSDKRRRWRRAEHIAATETAQAEEGRLFVQMATEAETVNFIKAAQELKTNATRPARQGFEGAARCRY